VIKIYHKGKEEQECFDRIDGNVDDESDGDASANCNGSLTIVV
jgi:hypothetical protein